MKDSFRTEDAMDRALTDLYQTDVPQSFEAGWRAAVRREERIDMNKGRRFWKVALPSFAAVVLVVGALTVGGMDLGAGEASRQFADSKADYGRSAGQSAMKEAMPEAMSADMASMESGAGALSGGADGGMGGGMTANGLNNNAQEKKLVRTIDMTLKTSTFDKDCEALLALVQNSGGYVENVYRYGDNTRGENRQAYYTLRIPTDKLDDFLGSAESLARLTSRNESTTDMTVQYSDTALRLQTQRDKMERLQQLLQKAETVSDLLEIETEIANTQYEIDSYETSLRQIDRQVDHTQVSVTLAEESPADTAAAEDVTLGQRILNGISASVKGIGVFFQNMLVFIAMALPVIVPVTVLGVALALVLRHKKRKKEQE